MGTEEKGPVLIEVGADSSKVTPQTAPPVPEEAPEGRAVQQFVSLGVRKRSLAGRLIVWVGSAILSIVVSLWFWDFVTGLLQRNSLLGSVALGLVGLLLLLLMAIGLREWAGFVRLRRLDRLRRRAEAAWESADASDARGVLGRLDTLYRARDDLRWARERMKDRQADLLDAEALLGLAETELMLPLDKIARAEVEAAARQVATITAIVPLALVDLFTALVANLRMIRRIAEIYGGRAGTLGGWRLTRTVLAHLVATGAVAVGDDLFGSIAGGGVLSKISRRFGEGLINGALTARVGVAAMEVCRPMPFRQAKRPSVTGLVQRALAGLFGSSKG